MQKMLRRTGLLSAAFTCLLVLAAAPVGMAHGDDLGSDSSSGSGLSGSLHSGSGSDGISSNSSRDENQPKGGDDLGSGKDRSSLDSRAQLFLEDKRESGKRHTKGQRQKACEERRANIYARTGKFGGVAEAHLSKLNSVFTKVQTFQTNKQLDVANYDGLVAVATAKQTAAQAAVDALKALNTQIDCSQNDPAANVAAVKTAVADARDALKAYRSAVKDVVSALKAAMPSDDGTSEDKS